MSKVSKLSNVNNIKILVRFNETAIARNEEGIVNYKTEIINYKE